jgi:polysaccharide export outer membrane protein
MRILDAISVAGGAKGSDYNTLVTLQRSGSSATVRLSTLLTNPENNIFVQPQDVIALKKEERYYNVLGAASSNSRVAFDAEKITVADALAKAGGLNEEKAEAATVVVLRREEPKTLEAMGVKVANFKDAEPIPAVYRFNLTSPAGMFLAQKMDLRNNDVVYVSNHPFTDATKLLGLFRDVLLIKLIEN